MKREGFSSSEDEEEGGDEMPKVARIPHRRPRRSTKPKASPTQQKEASGRDTSADMSGQKTHSLLAVQSSPEHMSGDEDSSEEEVYTDSLKSHTTASDSTTADILTSTADAVEDNSNVQPLSLSQTESQLIPDIPYHEGSTQPNLTTDSVFIQQCSDSDSSDNSQSTITLSPPMPPAPRRSTRSTKDAPPVHFGKVYSHSTIISEVAKPTKYKQTLYVPCYHYSD